MFSERSHGLQNKAAARAGTQGGGDGVSKPIEASMFLYSDGRTWIKPESAPNWIRLSNAVASALNLSLGGAR